MRQLRQGSDGKMRWEAVPNYQNLVHSCKMTESMQCHLSLNVLEYNVRLVPSHSPESSQSIWAQLPRAAVWEVRILVYHLWTV